MENRFIRVTLRDTLNARGLDQKRLAEMTGLTTRTISELASGKMQRLPKDALARIADALNTDDIRDIITIERSNDEY